MMYTLSGGRVSHPSEEQNFEDVRAELNVEGLYEYIREQPDDKQIRNWTFDTAVIEGYLNWQVGNDAGETGSSWYDELSDTIKEMWRTESEYLYEAMNHDLCSTFGEYKILMDYEELRHEVAKYQ